MTGESDRPVEYLVVVWLDEDFDLRVEQFTTRLEYDQWIKDRGIKHGFVPKHVAVSGAVEEEHGS